MLTEQNKDLYIKIMANPKPIVDKFSLYSARDLCCYSVSWLGYYNVLWKKGIKLISVFPNSQYKVRALKITGESIPISMKDWEKIKRQFKKYPTNGISVKERELKCTMSM